MTFDEIIDTRLWAVRYKPDSENELYRLLSDWEDVDLLYEFFSENFDDLAFFNVNEIEQAVEDTLEDRDELEAVFLDSSTNLETLFRPLDNRVGKAAHIEKMKSRGERKAHDSWLRIYAIRLADGKYIITGGAIKLTKEMRDREHTRKELVKIDNVRRFLLEKGIVDDDGFIDYLSETN